MTRDDLFLLALALLCLAGIVLGAAGLKLLKRDRSALRTDDTVGPSGEEDATEDP
jgi:hypothetical protein